MTPDELDEARDIRDATLLCINCGHRKELHDDPYGCEYESGEDVWVDGENMGGWVARGPCHCQDFQPEE